MIEQITIKILENLSMKMAEIINDLQTDEDSGVSVLAV